MVKEKLETLLIVLAKQKKLSANKFKDQVNKDFPKKMSQQTFFNVLKKAVDEKIIVQEQVMNGNQKMVYYTLPSYSQRQKELIHENEKQLGFLIHFANALLNKEFKYRSEDSKNIEDETEYIAEATVELFYHAMLINGFLETLPSVFGHIEKENADMLLAGLLEMIKKIRQRHLSDDKYVEHISDVAGIHYQELRDFFIEIAPDLHGIMVMEDPHDEGVDFRHLAKHGTKLEQLFFGEQVDFYKHWEELERADQATLDNTKKGRKKGRMAPQIEEAFEYILNVKPKLTRKKLVEMMKQKKKEAKSLPQKFVSDMKALTLVAFELKIDKFEVETFWGKQTASNYRQLISKK